MSKELKQRKVLKKLLAGIQDNIACVGDKHWFYCENEMARVCYEVCPKKQQSDVFDCKESCKIFKRIQKKLVEVENRNA